MISTELALLLILASNIIVALAVCINTDIQIKRLADKFEKTLNDALKRKWEP
jgi:hypothetical protein